VKHKYREDLLKFMVGRERDSMSEFIGTQTRFSSLDELRQALRASSLDNAWSATEEMHRVLKEWRQQAFDAAWRDREKLRERYCAAVLRDPALGVLIPCDGVVAITA
jgi:hypothetical protein